MLTHQSKRRVLTISVIVAILTIVLPTVDLESVGLVDLPRAEPEDVGMSSERLQRVDSTMQRYIDSNQLAGTVTLIARHGKVVHVSAQGWRHKEANQPMTADTIFTIMSMTKPIVSTALMMLYEEGYFLLDDPISKWLLDSMRTPQPFQCLSFRLKARMTLGAYRQWPNHLKA